MDERAAERPETLPSELAWRLREVETAVSPEEIAELWVFPPLSDVENSSEFLLFTRYLENERRRLYTARVPADMLARDGFPGSGAETPNGTDPRRAAAAENDGPAHGNGAGSGGRDPDGGASNGGPSNGGGGQEIRDHGTVPAERMPRFVENLLRRMDGADGEPIHVEVNGCRERWFALVPGSNGGGGHAEENGRDGGSRSSAR